ncbi:MAG: septum formation protein Maf [Nioella sp.]|nr:septum formation protein Maf [Nioella sp.]
MPALILATASEVRQSLLKQSGIRFRTQAARIDEAAIKSSMLQDGATPHDIADALAEYKARKVSQKHADAMVIGCDQVLEFRGKLLSKPKNVEAAISQLIELRGQSHKLHSAVVIYENEQPVWRHVGQVRLEMRNLSDDYIAQYMSRNWPGIADSVGAYKLEQEGVRLFSRVEGDYFTVLGLPLLELIGYLTQRGVIEG